MAVRAPLDHPGDRDCPDLLDLSVKLEQPELQEERVSAEVPEQPDGLEHQVRSRLLTRSHYIGY